MATFNVPYLTSRVRTDGSRYWLWQPGPKLRRMGWKAVQLNDEHGAPSTQPTALAQGHWLNAIRRAHLTPGDITAPTLIALWRDGGALDAARKVYPDLTPAPFIDYPVPGLALDRPPQRSLDHLIEIYQSSTWFTGRRRRTREGYLSNLNLLPAEIRNVPVAAISRRHLRKLYEALHATSGVHVANARMRALSAVLSYAVELEWIAVNPMQRFRMVKAPGRIRIASDAELAAIIAASDAAGMPSIGDAAMLARWTGQRRGDFVLVKQSDIKGARMKLRQSKTGKVVRVDMVPELVTRLNEAARRNRARHGDLAARLAEARLARPNWRYLREFGSGAAVLVNETSGLPWQPDRISHAFAEVRKIAKKSVASVATLRLADLRDTFVTYLVRNEFSLFEICALTGHTPASVQMICTAYVELTDDALAQRAGAKLLASIGREG